MCTCFENNFKAQKVKKQMLMFVLNTIKVYEEKRGGEGETGRRDMGVK